MALAREDLRVKVRFLGGPKDGLVAKVPRGCVTWRFPLPGMLEAPLAPMVWTAVYVYDRLHSTARRPVFVFDGYEAQ